MTTKLYPITLEAKVNITNGEEVGTATYHMKAMEVPSESDFDVIIEVVKKELPEGFRVMNRSEFVAVQLQRRYGAMAPAAIPPLASDEEWHDPDNVEGDHNLWALTQEEAEEIIDE